MMGCIMTVCLEIVRVLFVGTVTQLSCAGSVKLQQVGEDGRTSLKSERLAGYKHDV
jgi:hypothetical protein